MLKTLVSVFLILFLLGYIYAYYLCKFDDNMSFKPRLNSGSDWPSRMNAAILKHVIAQT